MADVTQIETQTDIRQPEVEPNDAPLLTITETAAAKVRELLDDRELEGYGLRVFVQGGGCSGLSYGMGFENNIYEQDRVVETDGVRLIIDPTSLMYMEGSEIDYVDSLMGGGFAVNNPNAVSSCGCGHSFRTEEGQAGGAGGCASCG
jgi:iron-sulfur cluster assembly accessory protein